MFKIALCLLLNAAILSAQTSESVVSLRDFSGGLNDSTTPIALKPNESPELLNVEIDNPVGGLKTRPGFITCGSIPSGRTITATHEYIRTNGNQELILTDNISVYSTLDCVTYSTITTGLSELALPYFDTFRDKLWIVNKSTFVITWDGATTVYLNGTGTLPNPPKGQYITHWKERVWLGRTDTEPSSVYFSALTDDSGTNINPSISSAAWPAINAFYIAQDDGSPIYWVKVFKDNLFVGKATGIWRIIFESQFNTEVIQSVSNIGCKFQDSVVELDNLLYFIGNDGIYKFDGNDVVRISQNIDKRFKTLKQPSRLDKYQLWDTATDWLGGTLDINVSTSPTDGSINLRYEDFEDLNYTANPIWTLTAGGALSASNGYLENTDIAGDGIAYVNTPSILAYGTWEFDFYAAGESSVGDIVFITTTTPIGSTYRNGYRISGLGSTYPKLYFDNTLLATGTQLISVNTWNHIKIERSSSGEFTITTPKEIISATHNVLDSSSFFNINLRGTHRIDNIKFIYKSTGTFTSQVSTFSLLSQWRTFDVDQTLNGQSITYQVKTATTPYNLGLTAYNSIVPGAIISTITANKNFQWKANFTTYDTSKTPLLNSAIANYQEGDVTTTRLAAINYDNRYWLTGSTSPATPYNDIVFVKSKLMDTWTVFDIPVSAFTKWNTNLYGGIANTAKVARLNFGMNDDGAAINAYWAWGDQHWPKGLSYKHSLKELYLYYTPVQSAANTKLSYSYDGGTNYTDMTVNLTGTAKFGLNRRLINGGIGNAFRFKVSNNAVDQTLDILGLDAWATPYINRE